MKAVIAAFNQEKALVGAFSVITNLRMELIQALLWTHLVVREHHDDLTGNIMHDVSIAIQLCSY